MKYSEELVCCQFGSDEFDFYTVRRAGIEQKSVDALSRLLSKGTDKRTLDKKAFILLLVSPMFAPQLKQSEQEESEEIIEELIVDIPVALLPDLIALNKMI